MKFRRTVWTLFLPILPRMEFNIMFVLLSWLLTNRSSASKICQFIEKFSVKHTHTFNLQSGSSRTLIMDPHFYISIVIRLTDLHVLMQFWRFLENNNNVYSDKKLVDSYSRNSVLVNIPPKGIRRVYPRHKGVCTCPSLKIASGKQIRLFLMESLRVALLPVYRVQ